MSQNNQHTPKISKFTVSVISLLSGLGIICLGSWLAYIAGPTFSWSMKHSKLVIETVAWSLIVPAIWLFGRPVAFLLNKDR